MDLLSILLKKVKKDDEMTLERKTLLCRNLSNLESVAAQTAAEVIEQYKRQRDQERRVGESETDIPYVGKENEQGVTFKLEFMPEELMLVLEQLVESNNR